MVTHDPSAAAIADRVVFLRDGRVAGEVAGGSTERVIDSFALRSTRAGRAVARHCRRRRGRLMLRSFDGLALRQLRTRPLRSVLTAFGIVLGVGMVFGVLLLVGTIRHDLRRR